MSLDRRSLQAIYERIYVSRLLKHSLREYKKKNPRMKYEKLESIVCMFFDISKKMYKNYKAFGEFYTEYPRFKLVPMLYSNWQKFGPLVDDYFENMIESDDVLKNNADDPTNQSFWSQDESVDIMNYQLSNLCIQKQSRKECRNRRRY